MVHRSGLTGWVSSGYHFAPSPRLQPPPHTHTQGRALYPCQKDPGGEGGSPCLLSHWVSSAGSWSLVPNFLTGKSLLAGVG